MGSYLLRCLELNQYSIRHLEALWSQCFTLFTAAAWSNVFWVTFEEALDSEQRKVRLLIVWIYALILRWSGFYALKRVYKDHRAHLWCHLAADVGGFAWRDTAEETLVQLFGNESVWGAVACFFLLSLLCLVFMRLHAATRQFLGWPEEFEPHARVFEASMFSIPVSWLITQTAHLALYGFIYRSSVSTSGRWWETQAGYKALPSDVIHFAESFLLFLYAVAITVLVGLCLSEEVVAEDETIKLVHGAERNNHELGGMHHEVEQEERGPSYGDELDQASNHERDDDSSSGSSSEDELEDIIEELEASSSRDRVAVPSRRCRLLVDPRGVWQEGAPQLFRATAGYSVGWAFMEYGQAEFRQRHLEWAYGPVVGSFVYAILVTFVGVATMASLSVRVGNTTKRGKAGARRRTLVAIAGIGLAVGGAYERMFDLLVEHVAEGGKAVVLTKVVLALIATAVTVYRHDREHEHHHHHHHHHKHHHHHQLALAAAHEEQSGDLREPLIEEQA
ncbi:unnamed protein product [Chrysoparadoxa australica]